jgi:hypothetical protein
MLDNQLIILIIGIINAQKSAAGISTVAVKQAYQPTKQGANTQSTAYLFKVGGRRVGSPSRFDKWDSLLGTMTHTETQAYETTFQISALAIQDPSNTASKTASDILDAIAYILQSSTTLATLQENGVGMQRVTDVRNPYFEDDHEQFEASPSFDFVLTHKQVVTSVTPVVQSNEFQILPV